MAWVVMRPGVDPLTAEGVKAFCDGRLAHYKIPRYVHVVDGFPMTVTGKVRKVEMREPGRRPAPLVSRAALGARRLRPTAPPAASRCRPPAAAAAAR
ncbi:hypothetical protein GCM10025868_16490 [Angustibacter aerolatus]|uniref:AMP-binding enzyme C-terminal domain-containing protein n=1 Tax=Angustibacter aerolatus TaxID=1162965 RepID=A0ABQ6JF26_9ACTN|nr:hypothetical protein GCM10025868_16490 [Angustibacter aerolatus]